MRRNGRGPYSVRSACFCLQEGTEFTEAARWQARPTAAADIGWLETGVDVSQVRPIDQLEHIHAPLLLIHNLQDHIIPPDQARQLAHRAQAVGLQHSLHLEEESPHVGMVIMNPLAYRKLLREWFVVREALPATAGL